MMHIWILIDTSVSVWLYLPVSCSLTLLFLLLSDVILAYVPNVNLDFCYHVSVPSIKVVHDFATVNI